MNRRQRRANHADTRNRNTRRPGIVWGKPGAAPGPRGGHRRRGLGRSGAISIVAILVGLCVLLGFGNITQLIGTHFAEKRFVEVRDSVQTAHEDAIAAELNAREELGVRFAEERKDLQEAIAAGDSARAQLAAELLARNIRIRQLTQVVAEARSALTSLANRSSIDTTDAGELVAEASGQLDDGLLSGAWRCAIPPGELALEYGVRIPVELLEGVGASGRTMVAARSPDPRVTLEVPALFVHTPDPPSPPGRWGTRFRWFTAGFTAAAALLR